jgi:hypothetical protein
VLRTEVRALGPDTWRVRFAVGNSGWLPAYVTKLALERKTARGVCSRSTCRPKRAWSAARTAVEGPQLEGHAPKSSLQAFLPNREVTADRAVRRVGGARASRHAHRDERTRRPRRGGAQRDHAGLTGVRLSTTCVALSDATDSTQA